MGISLGKYQSLINLLYQMIAKRISDCEKKRNMAHQSVGLLLPESDSAELSTWVRLGLVNGVTEGRTNATG